ncbi:hypothetical protein J6590_008232 [Homalodisca vitripennis]|nr:hypothetical protein J6590_008232 [Homalodisca vitripennis]
MDLDSKRSFPPTLPIQNILSLRKQREVREVCLTPSVNHPLLYHFCIRHLSAT